MHQAESVGNTDNQGRIIEPIESDTENGYTVEDDIVVKTTEDLGSRIDDANTAFDVDFEPDKREYKDKVECKASQIRRLKDRFDDFDSEDDPDGADIQFGLDMLLELEAADVGLPRQHGLTIPEAFVRPLNLKRSKEPLPEEDDDEDWETDTASDFSAQLEEMRALLALVGKEEDPVAINGTEVTMMTTELTDCERRLYCDPQLGCYRCHYLSPLRRCWTPVVKHSG